MLGGGGGGGGGAKQNNKLKVYEHFQTVGVFKGVRHRK